MPEVQDFAVAISEIKTALKTKGFWPHNDYTEEISSSFVGAIRSFQEYSKIPVTGVADIITLNQLFT